MEKDLSKNTTTRKGNGKQNMKGIINKVINMVRALSISTETDIKGTL
jgi:hypothetical protein